MWTLDARDVFVAVTRRDSDDLLLRISPLLLSFEKRFLPAGRVPGQDFLREVLGAADGFMGEWLAQAWGSPAFCRNWSVLFWANPCLTESHKHYSGPWERG